MDQDALARLADEPFLGQAKGFPLDDRFPTPAATRSARPRLFEDGFTTPIATLSSTALTDNGERVSRYAADRGVEIAPHGKTTMAPQLFDLQLRQGAWGITVATPWQARICRGFGVDHLLLANELTDPSAVVWFAEQLRDPSFRMLSYVDDPGQVRRNDSILDRVPASRSLDVLIELGETHGRTGCRDDDAAWAVADAVAYSRHHRLVGVAGYEGAIGAGTDSSAETSVRSFLARVHATADDLAAQDRFPVDAPVILTAGGSTYFDLVVDELARPLSRGEPPRVLLRSGAYLAHDDGLYATISPMTPKGRLGGSSSVLQAAVEVWTRVLSRPQLDTAYLDAGRRDLPFDAGMPLPRRVYRDGVATGVPTDWHVNAAHDQHTELLLPTDAELRPGDLLSLGISHPCTLFDKWRWLPVVDDDDRVIDVIRTFF